jgi:hypothetical protein
MVEPGNTARISTIAVSSSWEGESIIQLIFDRTYMRPTVPDEFGDGQLLHVPVTSLSCACEQLDRIQRKQTDRERQTGTKASF